MLKSREQRYTEAINDDNNVLFSCNPKNKRNTVLEVYFTLGIAGTVTGQKCTPFVIKLRWLKELLREKNSEGITEGENTWLIVMSTTV